MLTPQDRDVMQRAERLYEERLKAELEKTHLHAFVVIEPQSGDYFLGQTLGEAAEAARAAHPGRPAHIMRVGHRAAIHMGAAR